MSLNEGLNWMMYRGRRVVEVFVDLLNHAEERVLSSRFDEGAGGFVATVHAGTSL